jgi:hypothetical protein
MHYAAQRRARQVAQDIVDEIATNPRTPEAAHGPGDQRVHLRNAYYVAVDNNGDALIKCRASYWVYVEFGTGHGRAQPHVRPAIDTIRALRR